MLPYKSKSKCINEFQIFSGFQRKFEELNVGNNLTILFLLNSWIMRISK